MDDQKCMYCKAPVISLYDDRQICQICNITNTTHIPDTDYMSLHDFKLWDTIYNSKDQYASKKGKQPKSDIL